MIDPNTNNSTETIPFFRARGSLNEAAIALGRHWKNALHDQANKTRGHRAWWKHAEYTPHIERIAPHLPDLFVGLARGADIDEDRIGLSAIPCEAGCTSFALSACVTGDGTTLAGQNKDTPVSRRSLFEVVAFEPDDAPHFLTLTYPGWLFGHGFVRGGCAIFRNQLYAGTSGGMPYAIWGLLALHCPTVEAVAELAHQEGIAEPAHVTVTDEHGGIMGIEATRTGVHLLQPRHGIYAHANAVCADEATARTDPGDPVFTREESLRRQQRMHELLSHRNNWTCQSLFNVLADHHGAPRGICRHEDPAIAETTAAVVVDSRRGQLWATSGPPCTHAPQCYQLTPQGEQP